MQMLKRSTRITAYGSAALLVLATLTVTTAATATATTTKGKDLCGPGTAITLDRSAFPWDPEIENKWFPLEPGMQFTTTGKVVNTVEKTVTKRTVISTVTGLTKKIDGVNTVVVWDRDISDGELAESELAFFAETKKGTVWLFGEYPEEYENGKLVGAPSTFISGIDKAQAGIAMLDHPRPKEPAYPQAYAPSVDFLDCAKVVDRHVDVCVPADCYNNVLVIEESNPLEPRSVAGLQHKFYSKKTGLVQVKPVGGEDQESLDLVKIKKLSDSELKSINEQALALDRRGYTVSRDVYAKTPRAVVAKPGRR
ncbi:hypothetical protein [Pseudarthrobacter sp. MM222]|uniref:hypothetical protein n=1 Tax=Pseudarthrobacter sp. MM222 TaxID=3018929 RepID=UPI002220C978|nr:hypothetical protein [Pseudarthrobacter sp. MM222]CAI3798498.1 hypothetical protein NKCBBBOE_02091 [Pseudarthrobacter sp. MM222]